MSKVPENCIDCPNHEVIDDPDPHDWFCDDDKAVICTKKKNPKPKPSSKYLSDRSKFKAVAISCRPYKLREESETPDWCPLRKDS